MFPNAFLDIFLEITDASLNLADVFLGVSFYLQARIVEYPAGDFLDFTFGFFDSAFYLVFVHDGLQMGKP